MSSHSIGLLPGAQPLREQGGSYRKLLSAEGFPLLSHFPAYAWG